MKKRQYQFVPVYRYPINTVTRLILNLFASLRSNPPPSFVPVKIRHKETSFSSSSTGAASPEATMAYCCPLLSVIVPHVFIFNFILL